LDTRDGTCIRDFVHVADLGAAHLKALDYLASGGSSISLNLGTGRGTSIAEVLAVIEKVSSRKVPHTFAPLRVGDPPTLFAEAAKAKEILGWESRFGLEEIIAGAVRWEEQLPDWLNTDGPRARI
jgi:UDP-glucose 4-epimerase